MTPAKVAIGGEPDMVALGAALAHLGEPGMTVYLSGPLGAGKTTLVRGFLRALGHVGPVRSPTFTLVESYVAGGREVHHFDFYRLRDAEELRFLGFEDYLTEGSDCFVEWPDRARELLPKPDLEVNLEVDTADTRVARLCAGSERGRILIKKMFENKQIIR